MRHLTPDEIERYASRSGSVDEILGAAQHFEVCADCRDRAAALVDPGTGEMSHTRKEHRISGARPALAAMTRKHVAGRPIILWIVAAAVIVALLVLFLMYR
jgi:type VI protein secretion system component VasF